MTEQQQMRILGLANEMRKVAVRIGPMHSWWDVIFDMEAFADGKPTIVQKKSDEWINYAERLLTQNKDA